jgi:phosphate transport system substrate-binding protein
MKNFIKIAIVTFCVLAGIFAACKQGDGTETKETVLKGNATVLVDETFTPIIEEQITIFESRYDAKITLDSKSENEVIRAFLNDTSGIAILSRTLNDNEIKNFQNKKIVPKITKIGTDAIAFIGNKSNNDTLIALQVIVDYLQGKKDTKIKGLVFDNPNSSTVRFMTELAGISELPKEGVFSFKTNEDVIKFVSESGGMIGVVGLNWLYQPSVASQEYLKKIDVLSVKGLKTVEYKAPTQNNIAEGTYPLARDLYIINCQGYSGLGMGFASFVAGDIGQRIILKSGLLPVRTPGRKLMFNNNTQKDN